MKITIDRYHLARWDFDLVVENVVQGNISIHTSLHFLKFLSTDCFLKRYFSLK